MKIIFLTDIHLGETQVANYGVDMQANWERLIDAVGKENPDMVIFGGDIGTASSHEYFQDSLKRFPEVRLVIGNHDRYGDVIESMRHLVRGQNSQCFQEEIAGRKAIFLDSSTGALDSRQMAILEKALDQNEYLLIFIHHPILGVPNYVDMHYPLQDREQIQKLIMDSGVETVIFCGHYHMTDVRRVGNITQYITPAASYQIAKAGELIPDPTHFGYRVIHLVERLETHCVLFDQ